MASLTAATAGMASLSVSSGADNGGTAANGGEGLVFTAEERAAFAAVEAALLGHGTPFESLVAHSIVSTALSYN